ncbi:EAL domain-containing protein [Candidatus Gracilibacteria bacterium]|nr:EAL domain-containing protein [Candidatus Gracilibacteria bacterium]
MGSDNHRNHQYGLELYPQIEDIILDYFVRGKEANIDSILDYIKNTESIPWNDEIEIFARSIIKLHLQQVNSGMEIIRLNDEVRELVNRLLSVTTELDIIYARKGVLTVSLTGIIESVNDQVLEISGYSREELIGKNIDVMSTGLHSDAFWTNFYSTIKLGNVWEGEISNRGKDGSIMNFWTLVIPIIDSSGKMIFRMIRRDISDIKTNTEALVAIQTNIVDAITNLPTKKQMYLDYAYHLPKRISVVHINDMREMNMAYGDLSMESHVDIGGLVLQKIARLLTKYATNNPDLGIRIYKLTGSDYAIAYDVNMDQEFFNIMYEKMNSLKLDNFGIELDNGKDLTIHPSFSFGVALEGADIRTFLSNALSALAASKGQANRLAIYKESNDMKEIAKENIEMKLNIKQAFLSDGFVLDFQPIVQVSSSWNIRKLIKNFFHKKGKDFLKYEVLVRMLDPHDNTRRISPGLFLPIIEADNQNIQLTTRVIKKSCEFMVNNPGHFSINITANDINMVGRAKMIDEQVEKYGIDLSRFTFEILENIEFLTPVALDNINYFYKKGVLIAIDDYGTGFSSLAKLRKLHAHFLKLDMSLIHGIDMNPDNMADVRFAIRTAHKMGAEVIAEGVETEAERRTLKELGVDYLQGYLIGRPNSTI